MEISDKAIEGIKIVATKMRYERLLEVAEEMAIALHELCPDSSVVEILLRRFDEVKE